MRILVAGGAGYIGAHTCKALAGAGYTPVTYDNLSTGHADFVRWGPLVEGDIGDSAKVTAVCHAYGVVAAIHFAANAIVEESVIDPAKYYRNNVAGYAFIPGRLTSRGCSKHRILEQLRGVRRAQRTANYRRNPAKSH